MPSLLLALDEGPETEAAVAQALAFAQRRVARVHLLHVLKECSAPGPPEPAPLLEKAVRRFREAGVEVDAQQLGQTRRTAGHDIAAAAREAEVDLVALASKGVGEVAAILHGSASHDVLEEAEQPVLLLRGEGGAFVPSRILAATAGGDAQRLEAALSVVALPDTRVIVVHVPEVATGVDVPWVEPGDRALQTAEEAAASFRRSGLNAEARVRWGPVAFAITETAVAEDCDLIALGSRPPSDLVALLVGSVSQQVIQRSDRPVLLASKEIGKIRDDETPVVLSTGVDG